MCGPPPLICSHVFTMSRNQVNSLAIGLEIAHPLQLGTWKCSVKETIMVTWMAWPQRKDHERLYQLGMNSTSMSVGGRENGPCHQDTDG